MAKESEGTSSPLIADDAEDVGDVDLPDVDVGQDAYQFSDIILRSSETSETFHVTEMEFRIEFGWRNAETGELEHFDYKSVSHSFFCTDRQTDRICLTAG